MTDRFAKTLPRFKSAIVGLFSLSVVAASAQDATPPPKARTETVIVTAPADRRQATTVEMQGDDSAGGTYVTVWPKTAYQVRANGEATLSCLIDAYGLAETCSVVAETPPGRGFGRAALELRTTFRMTPAMGANGPEASTMSFVIHFKAPDSQFSPSGFLALRNPLAMRDVTMMDHPIWVQAAGFDDLAQAYPAGAGNVEGYAVAHCRVQGSGELSSCQIIKQSPEHLGFGKAALGLMDKFKILPALAATPAGAPIWVDLPIRFPAPGGSGQHQVNSPIWLVRFDPANAPKVFPPQATAKGLTSGVGVARCIVGPDGGLTGCAPAPGDPDGLGFSDAAVTLASVMKMNLWSADASPVVGAVALIKIRMNLQ